MESLVMEIKEVMLDFYGLDIPSHKINDYLRKNTVKEFDTIECDNYLNHISNEVTGLSWPTYGDTEEYTGEFFLLFNKNCSEKGYISVEPVE